MVFEGPKLLSKEKDKEQWTFLHKIAKRIIRKTVSFVAKQLAKTIERKQREGWIYPEVALLYLNFNELISKDAWKWYGHKDWDEDLWLNARDILCVLLDEDSYYTLRFFYLLEILNRDYDKYNISMHKNRAYWNWDEIFKGLKEGDPHWVVERGVGKRPRSPTALFMGKAKAGGGSS